MTGRCVSLPGSRSVPEPHGCLLLPTGNLAAALSPPNSGAAAFLSLWAASLAAIRPSPITEKGDA